MFEPKPFKKIAILTITSSIILLAYFLLSNQIYGSAIGHYGAEKHLNFSIDLISDNFYKYSLKFLTFFRYLPFAGKDALKTLFLNDGFQIFTAAIFVLTSIYLFVKRNDKRFKIALLCIGLIWMFVFVLAPVLNIEMSSLTSIQTDRYGYIPSTMFFTFIVILFAALLKKKSLVVFGLLLVGSTVATMSTVYDYKECGEVKRNLIESYPIGEKVWIINLPDMYRGVHLFRNGFDRVMYLEKGVDISESFLMVASIYMLEKEDGLANYTLTDTTLNTELPKWGRWFITKDYDNEFYEYKRVEGGPIEIEITFKSIPQDAKFYYQEGGIFKSILKVE